MATCSSILTWRIPWAEESGRFNPWGRSSRTRLSKGAHKAGQVWRDGIEEGRGFGSVVSSLSLKSSCPGPLCRPPGGVRGHTFPRQLDHF